MMKNRPEIVIGIDPDVRKSGLAYLDVTTKSVEVISNSFPQLLEYLQNIARNYT